MQESRQQVDTRNILQIPFDPYHWLAEVTSLDILTHLITKYAELEEEDVEDINQKMNEPISVETLFKEFVKKN